MKGFKGDILVKKPLVCTKDRVPFAALGWGLFETDDEVTLEPGLYICQPCISDDMLDWYKLKDYTGMGGRILAAFSKNHMRNLYKIGSITVRNV